MKTKKISARSIVCFPVDRAQNKTYKPNITVGNLPTLTTNSGTLMVVSAEDAASGKDDKQYRFMRHVRSTEKLAAQGFSGDVARRLKSSSVCQKAAGNAYPVNVMCAVLHPLLSKLRRIDLAKWPPDDMISTEVPACMNEAIRDFGKIPPKIKPRAKHRAKRKRPRHSDSVKRKRDQSSDSV